jgi:arylsulfatase
MLGGIYANSTRMYYPKVYNIEWDPHEELNVGGNNLWPMLPVFKVIEAYEASVRKYPNPPAGNMTNFTQH